jgi:hypothetical protein
MSEHVISDTSPAAAGTTVGGHVGMLQNYDSLTIRATLTGATGGTLDVYLQTSVDGAEWVDYIHFAQLADGAAAVTKAVVVSRAGQQTAITTVGTNASPALAANSVIGGDFGNQMRAVYVAGAGTSAGAAQVIRIKGALRRT